MLLDVPENRDESIGVSRDENIYSWAYQFVPGSGLVFFIVDKPVSEGFIGVMTTSDDVRWREEQLTDRTLTISLSGSIRGHRVSIEITEAAANVGRRRQQPNVDQSPLILDAETMDMMFPKVD
jgi:hypothetical protein